MEKEKPPVFGMIERGGQVVIHLLDNVKQKTIEPFIKDTIESGTLVYTDDSPFAISFRSFVNF
jgi:transposase-like protein